MSVEIKKAEEVEKKQENENQDLEPKVDKKDQKNEVDLEKFEKKIEEKFLKKKKMKLKI